MKNDVEVNSLLEQGFVEYSPNPYLDNNVDHLYQKCYRDDFGKKYYLTIKHYNLTHPTTGADLSGYEISGQFYLKGNQNAINMTFLDSDVAEAEKFINKLFELNLLEYYERWS